jgi:hypothetical protein
MFVSSVHVKKILSDLEAQFGDKYQQKLMAKVTFRI